jgi:hypothetical protein
MTITWYGFQVETSRTAPSRPGEALYREWCSAPGGGISPSWPGLPRPIDFIKAREGRPPPLIATP